MNTFDGDAYRRGFSLLLKRLRREEFGWKQKELAAKAKLSVRTIQDLETAQKAILDHETIAKLAGAFGLAGARLEEFFRAAGLSVTTPLADEIEWRRLIYEFHKSIDFPAFVSDDLLNIHSMNSYMIELLELDFDTLSEVCHQYGHFNTLYFFFHHALRNKRLYGSEWTFYTTANAWFLRNLSRPYVHTERYQRLFRGLHQLEGFAEAWAASEDFEMPLPPYLGTIRHQKYGVVRFWHSSAVKPNIKGEQMTFLFYHPADPASEEAFAQIRATVAKAAYQFTGDKGLVRMF